MRGSMRDQTRCREVDLEDEWLSVPVNPRSTDLSAGADGAKCRTEPREMLDLRIS